MTISQPKIIGKRMRAALNKIKANPGIEKVLIQREFGYPVPASLVDANLVTTEPSDLGFRMWVLKDSWLAMPKAKGNHLLKDTTEEPDRAKLIAHNVLAVQCPVCKMPAGSYCRSDKNGREVRWPHRSRIEETVYAQALLATLSRS